MTLPEVRYSVWLKDRPVGKLHQRGDYTWFVVGEDYAMDPNRPVLGLQFEQDINARHASALRLPPWFSNLLPEGILRTWIADERGVSADREMELLAQVGHDLAGAVQVLPEGHAAPDESWDPSLHALQPEVTDEVPEWRFSLAGVSLKFSMLTENDRLTLPAFGELGDTIVKLPDRVYPEVPRNEYAMMSLARVVGINVPGVKLVHRDELAVLPAIAWPEREEWAYAIKRFDRDEDRRPIHIEDFAQVRNFYSRDKYSGNLETVASLIYRGHDTAALQEFARRVAFNVLIANGDGHLKNWSLIYRNPRIPTLSPVYDLVSTAWYKTDGIPEDLGLKFGGSKRFETINLGTFRRLERKLAAVNSELPEVVVQVVGDVKAEWSNIAHELNTVPEIRDALGENIEARSRSLLTGGE